jgi:hypothetical protein
MHVRLSSSIEIDKLMWSRRSQRWLERVRKFGQG